jgi:hypothetical protein
MPNTQPEANLLSMLPFAVLLLSIAFAPPVLRHHWERHYHKLCVGLAAVTCSYYIYCARVRGPVAPRRLGIHQLHGRSRRGFCRRRIRLRVRGPGCPAFNTLFLPAGALLGNIVGTVGASMLLIRPWIAINPHRFAELHLAFFIFVVISAIALTAYRLTPPAIRGADEFSFAPLKEWPGFFSAFSAR